jgi:hypothetical protein
VRTKLTRRGVDARGRARPCSSATSSPPSSPSRRSVTPRAGTTWASSQATPTAAIERALVTIDYTPEVAAEARRLRAELVVAYHPPLFQAIKRIDAKSLVFQAIRDGIALYSPHTALDVAEGGTNDFLADLLELATRAPLARAASETPTTSS